MAQRCELITVVIHVQDGDSRCCDIKCPRLASTECTLSSAAGERLRTDGSVVFRSMNCLTRFGG